MIIPEQLSILENIGNFIVDSQLNSNWDKAVLKLALIGNSVDFNLTFFEGEEDKNTKLQGAFLCSLEVSKLYKITNDHPHYSDWNRAIYTLTSSNSCEIEYLWDQELKDEYDKSTS